MKLKKKSMSIVFGAVAVSFVLTTIVGLTNDFPPNTFAYFFGYFFGHFIVSFFIVYTLTLIITFILFWFFNVLGKKEIFSGNCYIVGIILATLFFSGYKFCFFNFHH